MTQSPLIKTSVLHLAVSTVYNRRANTDLQRCISPSTIKSQTLLRQLSQWERLLSFLRAYFLSFPVTSRYQLIKPLQFCNTFYLVQLHNREKGLDLQNKLY